MKMTQSMLALITAVGCLGSEPQNHPLLNVRRIYVEKLAGDTSSEQIRDMLINALQATRLFTITENAERSDATLKGFADDTVFTDTFQSQDGINARATLGSTPGGAKAGGLRRGSLGVTVSENDSLKIAERKHEATAAVRLISKEGDVLWATTQESLGAKFKGASADVAEKVVRQLIADIERARNPLTPPTK
jgi:hypothetical protein